MRKYKRIFIERAIYQVSPTRYAVISYDKTTKTTRNLFTSNSILECREFRDKNLRKADFGKGIQKVEGKLKPTYVALLSAKHPKNKKAYTVYLGSFDTPEEAVEHRKNFVLSLL